MPSDRPLIGITTCGRVKDGRFQLPAEYVDAVRRAGGVPVLLAPGEPEVEALLDRLDGIVLSGGGDIDPRRYGGDEGAPIERVDAERDEFELAVARRAAQRGLPTLGICRGCQVLNVALGGTLIEHLPDAVGEELAHRGPPGEGARHAIEVEPSSRLAAVLGDTRSEPVSWHHQAPGSLAPGLEAVARAADGTIEALEVAGKPALLAVQWHPELTAAEDPSQQRLFDDLVENARRQAR